jgi:hypothetical protein
MIQRVLNCAEIARTKVYSLKQVRKLWFTLWRQYGAFCLPRSTADGGLLLWYQIGNRKNDFLSNIYQTIFNSFANKPKIPVGKFRYLHYCKSTDWVFVHFMRNDTEEPVPATFMSRWRFAFSNRPKTAGGLTRSQRVGIWGIFWLLLLRYHKVCLPHRSHLGGIVFDCPRACNGLYGRSEVLQDCIRYLEGTGVLRRQHDQARFGTYPGGFWLHFFTYPTEELLLERKCFLYNREN